MGSFRTFSKEFLDIRKIHSETLISSVRYYQGAPRHHVEPKQLSWQWVPKKEKAVSSCKSLCITKKCPKPSFFPRLRKSYVPAEKNACIPERKSMSWKEYFSFLLPDPVKKPPMVTCRKLQAERRRRCQSGGPCATADVCLNDDCCPTPTEWTGQAILFQVPSPFPEPKPSLKGQDCAPAVSHVCQPQSMKEFNIEDYAYKRPFSNIALFDASAADSASAITAITCKHRCQHQAIQERLKPNVSCGYFSDLTEVKCPKVLYTRSFVELPNLLCKSSEIESANTKTKKNINVEIKKGACERTTFLKPYKYGERFPGMPNKRKLHTSVSASAVESSNWGDSSAHALLENLNHYQPSKCTSNMYKALTCVSQPSYEPRTIYPLERNTYRRNKLLSKYTKKEAEEEEVDPYHDYTDISPELLKMSEESRKYLKRGLSDHRMPQTTLPPLSLIQKMSMETTKRHAEEAKENKENFQFVDNKPSYKNKFSLCRPSFSYHNSSAKFSTTSFVCSSKKKKGKGDDEEKPICAGCPGVKASQEPPKPKSVLDCKRRPAGKCRGPSREPFPDEPEGIYERCREKPASICNQPRAPPKKIDKGYTVPCEPKRKLHSSAALSARGNCAPHFVSVSELMKARGGLKYEKTGPGAANPWDSVSGESYVETNVQEGVPDLSKYSGGNYMSHSAKFAAMNIPSMPKPQDEWEEATNKMYKTQNLLMDSKPDPVKSSFDAVSEKQTERTKSIKASSAINIWEKSSEVEKPKVCPPLPNTTGTFNFAKIKSAEGSKPSKFNALFGSQSLSEGSEVSNYGKNKKLAPGGGDFMNPLEE